MTAAALTAIASYLGTKFGYSLLLKAAPRIGLWALKTLASLPHENLSEEEANKRKISDAGKEALRNDRR